MGVEGGWRGSLKREWKQTGGGEGSSLSLCSLCEKSKWFLTQKIEFVLRSCLVVAEREFKTTEFPSDALTNGAITPWVQLALRVNFVQLLQFHRLLSVRFHFGCLPSSVSRFILIKVFWLFFFFFWWAHKKNNSFLSFHSSIFHSKASFV